PELLLDREKGAPLDALLPSRPMHLLRLDLAMLENFAEEVVGDLGRLGIGAILLAKHSISGHGCIRWRQPFERARRLGVSAARARGRGAIENFSAFWGARYDD